MTAEPSGERRAYPVERVGSYARVQLEEVYAAAWNARQHTGDLWLLQQRVFDARMAGLKKMISEGLQPCSDANVTVEIRVEQRAISDEVGDVGHVRPGVWHVTVERFGGWKP